MRKLLVLAALVCFYEVIKAQQHAIDSLRKVLSVQGQDTSRSQTLSNLSRQYIASYPDTALLYLSEQKQLSEKLNYTKGIIDYYFMMMYYYNFKAKNDSAIAYGKKAASLAKENKDITKAARSYLKIAEIYAYNGDMENGLAYCFDGIKETKETEAFTPGLESDFYFTIANIYTTNKEYNKGVPYYEKALEVRKKLGPEWEYYRLPLLINLANAYKHTDRMDDAGKIYQEAMPITIKYQDIRNEGLIHMGLVELFDKKGDMKGLKESSEKSLAIAKQINDSSALFISLHNLGTYHLKTGDFSLSKTLYHEAAVIARRIGDMDGEYNVYISLANNAAAQHDYTAMSRYRDSANEISTKQYSAEVARHMGDYEAKYKVLEKDFQIKQQQATLRQKNTLNYFLAGGAIALLLISLLAYRSYKQKQKLQQAKIDELETEKQLTATEAVLKGEEQERSRLAKDLHDGLGGMLSGIKYSFQNMKQNLILTPENAQAFERSIDMLDSSIQEMRRVAHNMMPEVLVRYGLDTALREFCLEINRSAVLRASYQSIGLSQQDKGLEQTIAIAVYRIVQELVNNSIKHAAAKHVLVQAHLYDTENLLTITVEDDGKGFDTTLLSQSRGIGWNSIQNRIDFLKGKIDIQSTPGNGTSVLIEIALG